ncbi:MULTISPECIES: HGGxSTG domain-containing protein [unclassified Sphingomonas]|uniref:HGGxSTG domain-containing protein n=1 Tax=unclassified Sphingomonas TaxID=196159 RepID=UPI0009E67ED8
MHKAHQAPRCLAKTRRGTECQSPAVRDKRRCRMHGGAPGSGGQPGNSNALKHGARSKELNDRTRWVREIAAALSAGILNEP